MRTKLPKLPYSQLIVIDCPSCGKSWDEGLVIDKFKKMREDGHPNWVNKTDEQIEEVSEAYGGPEAHFSSLIGIEDPARYDGVSAWKCPHCGTEWDRFSHEEI